MHRALLLLVILAACSNTEQYSSGADYIAARDANGPLAIDADIAKIAAVEPHLRFPAKIGVAQVVNGDLQLPDSTTTALFAAMVDHHPELGIFIPVSPLIASMVNVPHTFSSSVSIVQEIRRTAARQHLDYVLVYEIGTRSDRNDTPLAIADVTLIGGTILPTRSIKVAGIGQAIMLDVRNGYPYGTAQIATDLSGLARSFGTQRREEALRSKAILKTTKALIPEVEKMLVDLLAHAQK